MTILDEFLEKHGSTSLEHRDALDTLVRENGRGGGNFDESKVKRDKLGKFAKKLEAAGMSKDEIRDMVKAWKSENGQFSLAVDIALATRKEMKQFAKDMVAKYGAKGPNDPKLLKNKQAADEIVNGVAQIFDNMAKQMGVSPDGSERVSWAVGKKGNLYKRIIPYNGPMPEKSKPYIPPPPSADDRRTRANFERQVAQLPKTGGMRFNPNAKLDNSRVHDDSDPVAPSTENNEADDEPSWLYKLFHSDELSVEEYLEHADALDNLVRANRGGGNFDESKVKRDGQGQFAKKAGGPADKDAAWLNPAQMKRKLAEVFEAAKPAIKEMMDFTAQQAGYTGRSDPKLDNDPKAKLKVKQAAANVLNNYVENRGGTSPSGDKKIQYRVGNHGKLIVGVVSSKGYDVVSTHVRRGASSGDERRVSTALGGRPTTADTAEGRPSSPASSATAISRALEREQAKRRRGRFKFDAEKAQAEVDDWLDKLLHDDMNSDSMEHHGVKGMKWGVRKDVIGVTDLQPGGVGSRGIVRTFGAHDGKSPFEDEDHKTVANTTWALRSHLIDPNKGPFSPTGSVRKINNSYAKSNLKDPATRTKYDEAVKAALQKEIDKSLPKGAAGSIFTNPDRGTMVIYVGTPNSISEVKKRLEHSDDNLMKMEFSVIRDDNGFIISLVPVETDISHEEVITNFLEHHGIKGMKWGIRRTDAQLGNGDGGKNGVKSKSGIDRIKSKLRRKKDDDEPEGKKSGGSSSKDKKNDDDDTPTTKSGSADHESMMASLNKSVEGMSTRELQELNNRAQAMQNYQRLFGSESSGKSPLEQQVQNLQLQKQKRDLEAELTPERRSAAQKLIRGAEAGFNTYQKVDKAVGGDLSKALSRKLGLEPPPSVQEQAKIRTELAKAQKAEADARAAFSNSAKKVQADDLERIETYRTKGHILSSMLPPGSKQGLTNWDGVDRSMDMDHWTTKGYRIKDGVFQKNPDFGKAVPTGKDLISTVQKAPAYRPTHRADTPLERAKKLLGTQTVGNNPGFPVIQPSRVGSKRHRRD